MHDLSHFEQIVRVVTINRIELPVSHSLDHALVNHNARRRALFHLYPLYSTSLAVQNVSALFHIYLGIEAPVTFTPCSSSFLNTSVRFASSGLTNVGSSYCCSEENRLFYRWKCFLPYNFQYSIF